MSFKPLTPTVSVAPQISEIDVARAARQGYRAIIDNRPDGEDPAQPSAAEIAAAAARHGLAFTHVPVVTGAIGEADVEKMANAIERADGPVLAYCRTGTRSALLWGFTQRGKLPVDEILAATSTAGYDLSAHRARFEAAPAAQAGGPIAPKVHDVVIVGGGSGGLAAAASLLKRRPGLSIAIVEPSDVHYYQPGWTLVGAGVFRPETTRRPMATVMPEGVEWVRQAATAFLPESDEVVLADGGSLRYRVLVVAPGLKLDWAAVPGLTEALGRNGVTSNYRYDLAPYTHRLVQELTGGRALFTQPPMPIKCAGAPQKAMYLSCHGWRRRGVLEGFDVEFHNAGGVLFGVPAYVPALMEYVRRYGIDLQFESRLVAVDGDARAAVFERKGQDGAVETVELPFDMLHAVPPQTAPDFIRQSPLAGPAGWVDVDPGTLRHSRYPSIYSLGDVASTPNAKTAAAARKQAPTVALNVLATLDGREPVAAYDGYGSCPLTVERGKIVLAEFGYGGKLLPSFPSWLLNGTRPSRAAWLLKDRLLPYVYWDCMLKGREWLCKPHVTDLSRGRAA